MFVLAPSELIRDIIHLYLVHLFSGLCIQIVICCCSSSFRNKYSDFMGGNKRTYAPKIPITFEKFLCFM